jgi:hypothetical protein
MQAVEIVAVAALLPGLPLSPCFNRQKSMKKACGYSSLLTTD